MVKANTHVNKSKRKAIYPHCYNKQDFGKVTSYLNYLKQFLLESSFSHSVLYSIIVLLYCYKSSAPWFSFNYWKCLNNSANTEILLPCINVPGNNPWFRRVVDTQWLLEARVQMSETIASIYKHLCIDMSILELPMKLTGVAAC